MGSSVPVDEQHDAEHEEAPPWPDGNAQALNSELLSTILLKASEARAGPAAASWSAASKRVSGSLSTGRRLSLQVRVRVLGPGLSAGGGHGRAPGGDGRFLGDTAWVHCDSAESS